MKLFKSLLLASAAGLVAVSGASAADLGAKKPSPVEYVKACYNPLWGTSGGFVIPGTQTCLRVGGQARFDMQFQQVYNRSNAAQMGYRGGMTVTLDAITPSEYGNVRAFAQLGAMYRTGNQNSGTNNRLNFAFNNPTAQGVAVFGQFPNGQATSAAQTEINYNGFIQFAGFTAGRTNSFFRTIAQPVEMIGLTYMSGPGAVNTLAYTATLGNGFLATIAIEDPTTRRGSVVSEGGNIYSLTGVQGGTNASFANGFAANNTWYNRTGNRMPNLVGALRLDQAWGSAELGAILGEVGIVGVNAGAASNTVNPGFAITPSTRIGYGLTAGVKINLPMIAAGDNLVLNASYSKGNVSAVMSNGVGHVSYGLGVGGVGAVAPDATIDSGILGAGLRLTTAWGVTAGFQHFWTPALNTSIYASYASINVAHTLALGNVSDSLRDSKWLTLGQTTTWSPVRGLNIGLETAWVRASVQGQQIDTNKNFNRFGAVIGPCVVATGVGCVLKSSDSQFLTRFRVTRDF